MTKVELKDLTIWASDIVASSSLMDAYDRIPDFKELAHHILQLEDTIQQQALEIEALKRCGCAVK